MKKVKIFKIALATFTIMTGYSQQASAVGLDGAEVDFAVYCCAEATEFNRKSDVISAVVGSTVEFLSIENSGFRIASADINVSSTQIDVQFTQSARFGTGAFNGYVFDFRSIKNFSKIRGVSLNAATTLRSSGVDLSFDSDTIRISLPGQRITSRSRIVVDISFTSNESQFNPSSASVPLGNNQCIARYSVNGVLNIPCIAVSDAFGAVTLYRANLELLSSPPLDATFKLLEVQQTGGVSMMTNQCLANYSSGGDLRVPCVSVPSPFGNDLIYQVEMELVPFSSFSSPYIFKLTKTGRVN